MINSVLVSVFDDVSVLLGNSLLLVDLKDIKKTL